MLVLSKSKCLLCDSTTPPLFAFPKDPERFERWLKNINRQSLLLERSAEYIRNNARLCSSHFEEHAFSSSLKQRLSFYAVPINLSKTVSESNETVSLLKACSSGRKRKYTSSIFRQTESTDDIEVTSDVPETSTPVTKKTSVTITQETKKIIRLQTKVSSLRRKLYNAKNTNTLRNLKPLLNATQYELYEFVLSQIRTGNRNPKGRRWTAKDKAMALNIFLQNPADYKILRKYLAFPCKSTLRRSTGEIAKNDGFCPILQSTLKEKVKIVSHTDKFCNTHDIKHLKLLKSSVSKEDASNSNNSANISEFIHAASSNKECTNSPLHEDVQKKKGEGKKKITKRSDSKKWQKERDDACFNTPVNSELLDTDFDFEKNLALFDKQKVFDEINALSKSDHVKLVDFNKRGGSAKYRHDENIISGFIPVSRQISVPCKADKEYVTDSGLTVPSVSVEFKKMLFEKAEEVGFSIRVRLEMIGRAASELVLQLLGGNHRLNPQNTHQKPTVVILCGSHVQGSQGINCGRHLANHCVNVTALTQLQNKEVNNIFSNELDLFKLSGGLTVIDIGDLPPTVDIIIDALDALEDTKPVDEIWHANARKWAKQSKATLLFLDPPPDCKCEEKNIILAPALPFAFENEKCSLNICDIGLPQGIFYTSGCCYSSPFGSKFIITLYPKQD